MFELRVSLHIEDQILDLHVASFVNDAFVVVKILTRIELQLQTLLLWLSHAKVVLLLLGLTQFVQIASEIISVTWFLDSTLCEMRDGVSSVGLLHLNAL